MNNLEQLQSLLDQAISKGRKPRWDERQDDNELKCYEWRISVRADMDWSREPVDTDWYHWLFSKDSGLIEFVSWEKGCYDDIRTNRILTNSILINWKKFYCSNPKYQYMVMWPMTDQEKVDYFITNAIISCE